MRKNYHHSPRNRPGDQNNTFLRELTNMKEYTINSECGIMIDFMAEDIDAAKEEYSRKYHYDFDVDQCPGSWYCIFEDGVPVESVTENMPN
jgi:hypothetical protein